jgi:hypothetical protein
MKLLASRKAAGIAVISALPFISAATYYFYLACTVDNYGVIYWWISEAILMLGSPLTLIYMLLMPYIGAFLDRLIANQLGFLILPVYILLFIIQWIIWSQLIVIAWRRLRRIRFNKYP